MVVTRHMMEEALRIGDDRIVKDYIEQLEKQNEKLLEEN